MAFLGFAEINSKIRIAKLSGTAHRGGHILHKLGLRRNSRLRRDRSYVEHVRGQVVVRIENFAAIPRRPTLFEDLRWRSQVDVCLNERAAAETCRLNHHHLRKML